MNMEDIDSLEADNITIYDASDEEGISIAIEQRDNIVKCMEILEADSCEVSSNGIMFYF